MAGVQIDGVNNKIDFDDDLDTSISANTDDTLVFEIAGATDFTMTANTFTAASGSTIAAQALTATTGAFTNQVTISTAGVDPQLQLISTEAGATQAPILDLYRNSSSPADDDTLGQINYYGENSADEKITYVRTRAAIADVTDGDEGSTYTITSYTAGSQYGRLNIQETESVFNENSADIDFRVESNGNTHMLFVDGGNNRVNMGSATDVEATLVVSAGDSGVTTPDANGNLFVIEKNDNCGMSILSSTDGGGYIHFGDSGDIDIGVIEYSHPDNSLRFTVNAAERMRIHDNGRVAIGTTNGDHVFQVIGEASAGTDLALLQNTRSSGVMRGLQIAYSAQAPNDSNPFFICEDTAAVRFIVRNTGNVENTNNSYGATSDERIKSDIVDANSQWNDIKAIKVRNYKKKDDVRQYGDNAKSQIGVIAQELEAVSPKLVQEVIPTKSDILSDSVFGTLYTVDDAETQDAVLYTSEDQEVIDGDKNVGDIKTPSTAQIGEVKEIKEQVKSVSYSVLYMKAIKALQEAQTRIETLETKVTALEG